MMATHGHGPRYLVEGVRRGDVRAAARLITQVENQQAEAIAALKALYPSTGRAHVIGITGPPGTGKSTLTDQITVSLRRRQHRVGVIAVDPTSPFTGGAILADRVRMQRHSLDDGVFIRSMATRGNLGGLSRATLDVVDVMDAMGKEFILVETVGAGQDEVEIVRTAHTTLVVAVPGLGDGMQAFKAGMMEIGDVFVVNKADRDGADQVVAELQTMLEQGEVTTGWHPPVVRTVATRGEGIVQLLEAILTHRDFRSNGSGRSCLRRERSGQVFRNLFQDHVMSLALERLKAQGLLESMIDRIACREVDPHSAVEETVKALGWAESTTGEDPAPRRCPEWLASEWSPAH
jgi:LAO/AO transport system kinase